MVALYSKAMSTQGDPKLTQEPLLSDAEREEMSHLDFLCEPPLALPMEPPL